MSGELVSIVIPCYNAACVVERAVASAYAQTHRPVEVICVDDGSIDETPQVLRVLQEKYTDLQVIRQSNGGAPRARNAGLAAATGIYIQFLDADDELLPEKVLQQVRLANKESADLVVGSCIIRHLDGTENTNELEHGDPWILLPQVKLGNPSSNLFRRRALLEIGGWNENLLSSQEYDLMFRMLKLKSSVVFDRGVRTIVHRQLTSISNSNILENCMRRINHLLEVRTYLSEYSKYKNRISGVNAALFEEIRHLANHDIVLALDKFDSAFPYGFRPIKSKGTTRIYVLVYRILGFRRTEKLRHRIRHCAS